MTNAGEASRPLHDEVGRLRNQIAALRESEASYRNLIELSPEMIAVHRDGVLIYINPRGVHLLGANSAQQVIGRSFQDFIHPGYHEHGTRYQRLDGPDNTIFVSEEKIIRLDGQVIDVEITETAILYRDEPATQLVVRDITGRRRFEEALRRSEEQFRAFISSMSDLVFMLDTEQRFTGVFGVWLEKVGMQPHTFLGRTACETLGEEMAHAHESANQRALAGESVVYEWQLEIPDHGTVYLQTAVSPLRNLEGDIVGIAGIGRDITDLKRSQEERERLIADMDAFSHTVAHDLKHPLNLVVGYASMLEADAASMPPEDVREYLHGIVRTGLKMGNIIEELLLLAGVRKQEVQMRPLPMSIIVSEAQKRLAYLVEEYQAQINVPDYWPTALGYGPWIEEVWINYLSNAIKYGGHPPIVMLGATPQADGTIRFWVRDNGPGLTPEQQREIFIPFTRLSQARTEGHGLGLSIVQRIMQRLGGQVHVESQIGKGSEFSFILPAAPELG